MTWLLLQTNMEAKGVVEVLEHDLEGLYVKLHNKGDKVGINSSFFYSVGVFKLVLLGCGSGWLGDQTDC